MTQKGFGFQYYALNLNLQSEVYMEDQDLKILSQKCFKLPKSRYFFFFFFG